MTATLRISVSDLQCYQRYRDREEVTLEECLSQLRRERPPTEAMMAGSALHKALEKSVDGTEAKWVESEGYQFCFGCEIDLTVPDVRELKGEVEMLTPSGPVTLVGVVDAINGSIYDYKLTGRFEAEWLIGSWQWRCYLWMFKGFRFEYRVFVGEEVKPREWLIREYHELPVYAYAGMEGEIRREIEECAAFMARYVGRKAA